MSDDLEQRQYPEDERLRRISEDPDRRMTRDEWEREESDARQAAHKKHQQIHHDREQQQEYDRKHRSHHLPWTKILKWGGLGVLILLLIFFLGWLPHHRHQEAAKKAAQERDKEVPQVEVVQAIRAQSTGDLTLPGTTDALAVAYVYARANGYLRQRFVDIGDRVRKGQLLAVIDSPDLDAQVDQARQQLHQAEADESQQQAQLDLRRVTWDRWRVLVQRGVFSRQDGDQREADYKAQVAVVDSAHRNVESYRANLLRVISLQEYEKVRAPFDGVVTQRNTDVGALINTTGAASSAPNPSSSQQSSGSASTSSSNTGGTSGTPSNSATPSTAGSQGGPLFAIAQTDVLRILVSAPEGYATSLHAGIPAKVYLQERAGAAITGVVTRTANSLDQNTRTMVTEVDVSNKTDQLYPGMYAIVSFSQVRGNPPIVIPGDAIVVRNDRTSVATVHDNKIQMKQVEIGRDYGPEVEILSGLQEGEWVVSTVTDDVQPNVRVRTQVDQKATDEMHGSRGQQTNQTPNSGPSQYGDQSIVNSSTENTTQKNGQQRQEGKQSPGGSKQPQNQKGGASKQ
jgi:multidrug efflux pump subunit AcrA (membrane-fusion protein)